MMKRVRTFKTLGKSEIKYESDNYNGEYLDTDVYIGSEYLCTIAGNTIQDFHDELTATIEKFRI